MMTARTEDRQVDRTLLATMVAIRIQRFVAQATYDDVPAPFEDTSSQIRSRWTTPIRLRQLARPIKTRRGNQAKVGQARRSRLNRP